MENNVIDKETEEAKKQAQHFGIDFISLRGKNIPYDTLSIIPEDIARRNQLVVYDKQEKHIFIAISDPEKLTQKAPQILSDLKNKGRYYFNIFITTPSDLHYALLGYKQKDDKKQPEKDIKTTTVDKDIQTVSLKEQEIPYETLIKFPQNIAAKYRIIIFAENEDGKKVKVAVEDPENLQTQEILDFISARNDIEIEQFKTNPADIDWALTLYDKKPEPAKEEKEDTKPISLPKREEEPIKKEPLSQEKKIIPTMLAKEIKQEKEGRIFTSQKEEKNDAIKEIPEQKEEEEKPEEVTQTHTVPVQAGEVKSIPQKEAITIGVTSEEEQNLDKLLPGGVKDYKDLAQIVQSGSIPKIVAAIIYLATKLEASDIHIEAAAKALYLRYRIDGILKEVLKMPVTLQAPIVSRIKILAKLKIDEQRIPQDGRFDVIALNKPIDLRISTLPTVHGEKVVMRLLDKTTGLIGLEKLGLSGVNLKRVQNSIEKPYGIILVTGPTGSGKTTTLYAILNKLNTSEVNIVTLEDPVEYELPGVNQCQIKPKIGFGFANGLRSILRQDPNIIMVGEIRDGETANMATHAALTGHLVLSTLHTNDSCGALPRLIDMGVEPFLITSSINAIIAQRLVRKLCDKCKEKTQIPERLQNQIKEELSVCSDLEIKKLIQADMIFYKPKGCAECKDGYKGRIGLYEVLTITDRIEQLAVNRTTTSIIKRAALNQGLVTIRQDGFAKALNGVTSIDEIIRVTSR